MHILLLAFAIALAPMPAAASSSQTAAAVAAGHRFMDGLNKGDLKGALAVCANPTSILDDFAPHVWHGSSACADWANAFAAFDKSQGISGDFVTLSKPLHADVDGETAYVVYPATYTYVQRGKHVSERALFTVALRRISGEWRITSWAWSKQ